MIGACNLMTHFGHIDQHLKRNWGVYGKPCCLSVELEHKAYLAIKQCKMDMDVAGEQRKLQLNEVEEIKNDAYESS